MTYYKELCADLVDDLELCDWGPPKLKELIRADVERARAALAVSEMEVPTDEELMALAVEVFDNPCVTDKDYARAVLARWGNRSAPQPIPIAAELEDQ